MKIQKMSAAKATTEKYPSTMYKMVFESIYAKMGVLVLFGFLLLQPVSLAFANEVAEETSSQDEESSASLSVEIEPIPEDPVEEPLVENAEIPEEEVVEGEVAVPEEVVNETVTDDGSGSEVAPEEVPTIEEPEVPVEESPVDEETSEEGEEETSPEEEVNEEEVVPEETIATTTPTTTETIYVAEHNADQIKFQNEECVSVGDGAFYCSTAKTDTVLLEDGVFSAPDADGDLEIFVRLNGEESQLTFNNRDDSSPYYDALSDRIVWHSNYNDRYQVISYDMRKNEEFRLTDSAYNNMEPVAYGDITMWQAWINNNWEIMLYDGTELKQLTNNTTHDVSPSIRGGYIVWQSQFADGWQVAMFDQETGHIEYIKSESGAKVENPRFVLVYDSTNGAGDIQTLGYDFDNNRSFALSNVPAQLPDELPEPDQTGETRALIQNKHSVKGVEIEESEPVPTGNNGTSTASSTPNDGVPTLDLTASSSSAAATTPAVFTDVTELVIPPYATPIETEEISHIPDILIPPTSL
jgi:hypothetical protein